MKRLQQLEPGLNAYTVSFDSSLLDTLRTMFDDFLKERLNREGYDYLFAGMEQINIQMKLEGQISVGDKKTTEYGSVYSNILLTFIGYF